MDIDEETMRSKICFVPCLKWVKKGVAKADPEKVELSKEELARLIKETKEELDERENAEGEASQSGSAQGTNQDGDEYNMANYDDDDTGKSTSNQWSIANACRIAENLQDEEDEFSDDDDSEKEDDKIKPTDNLILVGKVQDEVNLLEVYIYNEQEDSMYCHHDLILPSFPLCIEWLDHEPGCPPGNYCAIGTMSPIIDVWDLDVINCLEPAFTLGRKGSKKKGITQMGHKDAVLDISWNKNFHHIIASGSVDQTVLLWDIDKGEPSSKITAFKEKVQTLMWHRLEGCTLLAGGCDNTVKVFDCRTLDSFLSWDIEGEAERVVWNSTEPYMFFVGTSNGYLQCFDCRTGLIWSIKAHEKEVTGLSISGQCPGLLITTSPDEHLKVWDIQGSCEPSQVYQKHFTMGALHCLELCPDLPFTIAVGGDDKKNHLMVLDLKNLKDIDERFGSRPLIELEVQSSESSSNNS